MTQIDKVGDFKMNACALDTGDIKTLSIIRRLIVYLLTYLTFLSDLATAVYHAAA